MSNLEELKKIEEMLELIYKNTVAILKLLNYDTIGDLSIAVNSVAAYEKYESHLEHFKEFPGDSKEDVWNKNRHKPAFIKKLNSLF